MFGFLATHGSGWVKEELSTPLTLSNLVWRHHPRDNLQHIRAVWVASSGGNGQPFVAFRKVLCDTQASCIATRHADLRAGHTLTCGFEIPRRSFSPLFPQFKFDTQSQLRVRIAVISRPAEPLNRLLLVIGYPIVGRETNTKVMLSRWKTLLGGFAEPFDRLSRVLDYSLPIPIAKTHIVLRVRIALFGGLEKPPESLGLILGNPGTLAIGHPQTLLRLGGTMDRSFVKPRNSLLEIHAHSHAVTVTNPQIELRLRQSLIRGFAIPLRPLNNVSRCSMTIHERQPQVVLGGGIALKSGLAKPPRRLLRVLLHPVAIMVAGTKIILCDRISVIGHDFELIKTLTAGCRRHRRFNLPVCGCRTRFIGHCGDKPNQKEAKAATRLHFIHSRLR